MVAKEKNRGSLAAQLPCQPVQASHRVPRLLVETVLVKVTVEV
jgi:hypothetical protein